MPLASATSSFAASSSSFTRHQAAPVAARAPARVRMAAVDKSKVPLNLYRPNSPLVTKCIYNELIVGEGAPGETNHVIFNHDGNLKYLEGQSIGVMAPGLDAKGKPHKVRLYSIASTQHGDFGDDKTISLVVKRLVYEDEEGNEVKGVCSNHICDLKPGDDVAVSGPVGTAMLMPTDPNATIIMLATGTGIAPFRSFMRRAFAEKNDDYNFKVRTKIFVVPFCVHVVLAAVHFGNILACCRAVLTFVVCVFCSLFCVGLALCLGDRAPCGCSLVFQRLPPFSTRRSLRRYVSM